MSEIKISIRRNGELIGSWDKFEIRQYVANGSLVLTDEAMDPESGEWGPLIPPYRRKHLLFDWSDEEDHLCYYVRDGHIHGPRTVDEIEALIAAGYLTGENLFASLGSDQWMRVQEILDDDSDSEFEGEPDNSHFNAAKDHVLTGNFTAAAVNAGIHFLFGRPRAHPRIDSASDDPIDRSE